ncbi:MAG: prepilin peptidase [Pseudomonadota bacterium]
MILSYSVIFIFGLLIGNFATTLLYRLPRDIIPYGFSGKDMKPPFCSRCKHALRFYEYLPVLSWISTKGSCNYCHEKVSNSYFYLEVACGVFAILCAYLYSQNIDIFFLKFCVCVTASLSIAIYTEHKTVSRVLTIALITEAAFFRTLQDQSIISWVVTFSFAAIFSMLLFQMQDNRQLREETIHIILPTSILVEGYYLLFTLVIFALLYFLRKNLYHGLNFYNFCIITVLACSFL